MEEIINLLPSTFRPVVAVALGQYQVEELRLRSGQKASFVTDMGEFFLDTPQISPEDLEEILSRACDFSIHAVQEQIARGFLTMTGGHRLGLCGTAVMEGDRILTLRNLSSLSLRFARAFPGISTKLLPGLWDKEGFSNTLILSPAGAGKSTLLRDIIRGITCGEGIEPLRVALVDERGEIAGMRQGMPGFDLGCGCDVLEGCPKALGLIALLRSMNPQILAVDEITAPQDVEAMTQVSGCGVKLLATAHGSSKNDLLQRPTYRLLFQQNIFTKLLFIRKHNGRREYVVEAL